MGAFFLGPNVRFLVQKSDFCHTTPILVDDPFLALGMTVTAVSVKKSDWPVKKSSLLPLWEFCLPVKALALSARRPFRPSRFAHGLDKFNTLPLYKNEWRVSTRLRKKLGIFSSESLSTHPCQTISSDPWMELRTRSLLAHVWDPRRYTKYCHIGKTMGLLYQSTAKDFGLILSV